LPKKKLVCIIREIEIEDQLFDRIKGEGFREGSCFGEEGAVKDRSRNGIFTPPKDFFAEKPRMRRLNKWGLAYYHVVSLG
jgi:hypothetical protein